jgi:hypothetical protein
VLRFRETDSNHWTQWCMQHPGVQQSCSNITHPCPVQPTQHNVACPLWHSSSNQGMSTLHCPSLYNIQESATVFRSTAIMAWPT